jgi:hypothetical protein
MKELGITQVGGLLKRLLSRVRRLLPAPIRLRDGHQTVPRENTTRYIGSSLSPVNALLSQALAAREYRLYPPSLMVFTEVLWPEALLRSLLTPYHYPCEYPQGAERLLYNLCAATSRQAVTVV